MQTPLFLKIPSFLIQSFGFFLKKHENCRKFQNQQELCLKTEY
jgi:hypothetical protein